MVKKDELVAELERHGLADELATCSSLEEIVEVAQKAGIGVSVEDVEAATDLSEDDLDGVAGGVALGFQEFEGRHPQTCGAC